MNKVRIINGTDYGNIYDEQYFIDNPELTADWVLTDVLPNPEFQVKKWNGSVWYEGATIEDINSKKAKTYIVKLQSTAAELRMKAKAAAIGKTGTQEYIFSQVELYELKFKVASGIIVNAYITSLIENEAVEFGLPIQDFKNLIISMYNSAKEKYEVFLFMIERCRTKIQTLIEMAQFEAVETAFGYIGNLSDVSQAEQTMTNILAL